MAGPDEPARGSGGPPPGGQGGQGAGDEALLSSLGVQAFDASLLERDVMRQAQVQQAQQEGAGAGLGSEASGGVEEVVRGELAAVRKEIRTLTSLLERGAGAEDGADEELVSPGAGGGGGGGALQMAVVAQRLEDLCAKEDELKERLAAAAVGGAGPVDDDGGGGGGSLEGAAQAGGGSAAGAGRAGEGAGGAGPSTSSSSARTGVMGPPASKKKKKKARPVLMEDDLFDEELDRSASRSMVETERDRLIRTGVITPFDRLQGFERNIQRGGGGGQGGGAGGREQVATEAALRRARELEAARPRSKIMTTQELPTLEPSAVVDMPSAAFRAGSRGSAVPAANSAELKKRRREHQRETEGTGRQDAAKRRRKKRAESAKKKKKKPMRAPHVNGDSGSDSDYLPREDVDEDEDESSSDEGTSESEWDDADEDRFERRAARHRRRADRDAREAGIDPLEGGGGEGGASGEHPSPDPSDIVFDGGYRLPVGIWDKLFDYQRTGVKWMWELHTQRAGGIIGDEMGLGKTVQVAAFLAGLHYSGLFSPSLVACPATMMRQWLRELRKWYPHFRVAILHESARAGGGGRGAGGGQTAAQKQAARAKLVKSIASSSCGILVTTYDQIRNRRDILLPVSWGYVVLDEGHKIRNPDVETTLVCKQVQTVHRLIMTGAPIQNRLTELWSLFDFVFPGKIGTLPVFQTEFAIPIQIGGYTNASQLQVATAYRCAVVLRDLISPYLLRRRKCDVNANLPQKTEQVLFCSLTKEQRDVYRAFLGSREVEAIYDGKMQALAGIDVMKKICNHPDLLEREHAARVEDYGAPERSGKLMVVSKVLELWKSQGHRCLLFSQTQQMLDILEELLIKRGYTYRRMDGSTSVGARAGLIDTFNEDEGVFCFLLTTRVGGLGVNLIGANRVLLYDPDWNPSTDIQARERAWRVGQTKDVTVYRLVTSGTIEEKIYHRQVYKQFLTNKILHDPKQRRFFASRDIRELFTLGDEYAEGTETASIFAGVEGELKPEDLERGGGAMLEEGSDDDGDGGGGEGGGGARGAGAGRGGGRGAAVRARGAGGRAGAGGRGRGRTIAGARAVTPPPPPGDGAGPSGTAGGGSGGNTAGRDDAKILRDLLNGGGEGGGGGGIQSAMNHDAIVSAAADGPRVVADYEARRVAERAADALRRSRQACRSADVSVPTWTGRSGLAGAPAALAGGRGGGGRGRGAGGGRGRVFGATANPALQRPPAGAGAGGGGGGGGQFGASRPGVAAGSAPTSSQLLARMKERRQAAASVQRSAAGGADRGGPSSSAGGGGVGDFSAGGAEDLAARLAEGLCEFLAGRGGGAPSSEVVRAFQERVGRQNMALFKQVLKQVAALGDADEDEEGRGGKVWRLRPDFAPLLAGGGGL